MTEDRGKAIADRYDRHGRWGRLAKGAGLAGQFSDDHGQAVPPDVLLDLP